MNDFGKDRTIRTFFQAVSLGNLSLARMMLAENPELARLADSNRKTVLHVAAERDNPAMVETLLDAGAELEAEANWGHTPLQWAGVLGSRRAAEKLIARGADGLNLPTAAGLGMLERVKGFWNSDGRLSPRASFRKAIRVPDGGWSRSEPISDPLEIVSEAFYQACRNGHLEVARILLEHGADIERRGFFGASSLHWAALNGHRETVEFLIRAGADIDAVDPEFKGSPVSWANEGRHPEIVDLLLRQGARCTPGQAAAFGKLDLLRQLLARDPDASLETGRDELSPLWQAAHWGRSEVVDWLLQRGADANGVTVGGATPLHGAASGGASEIMKVLLKRGADPNARADSGLTPLHVAAGRGDAAAVRLLLEAGADPSAKARNTFTPAIVAKKGGHSDLAEQLCRVESGG